MTRLYLLQDYNGVHIKITAEATINYFKQRGTEKLKKKHNDLYGMSR